MNPPRTCVYCAEKLDQKTAVYGGGEANGCQWFCDAMCLDLFKRTTKGPTSPKDVQRPTGTAKREYDGPNDRFS